MNQLEQKLEQDFGIVFSQKDLLETAFTHTSYANEHRLLNISHNERLEFLGDAGSAISHFCLPLQSLP